MGLLNIASTTSKAYFKESSVAGVSHAAKSGTYLQCFYWSLLFVAGLCFTVPALIGVVGDYYTYPITTKIRVETADSTIFPAVTICSLNRIHCANLFMVMLEFKMNALLTSDPKRLESNETLSLLETIIEQSRCRQQMCEYYFRLLYKLRFDSTGDWLTPLIFNAECWKDHPYTDTRLLLRRNTCYNFFQLFTYAFNITEEVNITAQTNWDTMNCTEQEVCDWIQYDVSDASNLKSEYLGGVGLEHLGACAILQESENDWHHNDFDLAADLNLDENELRNNITLMYMKLPKAVRARVGHQLGWDSIDWGVKGLLHSCSFLEEDCNNERISNNPDYGNCYTFNAIYNNDGVRNAREVTMTGESATLSIVLFLDQLFYTPLSLTKEAGARITIHDPKAFPMVDEYGMNLRPTTASHIGFQQHVTLRKEHPYQSNCTTNWTETNLNLSKMVDMKPQYSIDICKRNCMQQEIINVCQCFHTKMDLSLMDEEKIPEHTRRPCSVAKNGTDYTCFTEVLDLFKKGTKNCDTCNVACRDVKHPYSMTTATWPSDSYWRTLAANIGIEIEYLMTSSSAATEAYRSDIIREYVKADLYYQTLDVNTVEEEAVYTPNSLVSALGGAFSLYLGIAIILLFELLELAVQIIAKSWKESSEARTKVECKN